MFFSDTVTSAIDNNFRINTKKVNYAIRKQYLTSLRNDRNFVH